jgi:hypothetical protein
MNGCDSVEIKPSHRHTMSESPLSTVNLFDVKGLVAVITGGGTGEQDDFRIRNDEALERGTQCSIRIATQVSDY